MKIDLVKAFECGTIYIQKKLNVFLRYKSPLKIVGHSRFDTMDRQIVLIAYHYEMEPPEKRYFLSLKMFE